MGWFYLLLAGALEVGFTTVMRRIAAGGGAWTLHLVFLLMIVASLQLLQMSLRTIPMGTAYVVWTGIGAVGTVIVGILFFGEEADPVRLGLLAVIVAAVAGLKFVSPH